MWIPNQSSEQSLSYYHNNKTKNQINSSSNRKYDNNSLFNQKNSNYNRQDKIQYKQSNDKYYENKNQRHLLKTERTNVQCENCCMYKDCYLAINQKLKKIKKDNTKLIRDSERRVQLIIKQITFAINYKLSDVKECKYSIDIQNIIQSIIKLRQSLQKQKRYHKKVLKDYQQQLSSLQMQKLLQQNVSSKQISPDQMLRYIKTITLLPNDKLSQNCYKSNKIHQTMNSFFNYAYSQIQSLLSKYSQSKYIKVISKLQSLELDQFILQIQQEQKQKYNDQQQKIQKLQKYQEIIDILSQTLERQQKYILVLEKQRNDILEAILQQQYKQ